MLINQKISKFFIFLFFFSIYSSISQTNEGVPLNNLAISEIPKPISPIIFKDFSGKELTRFRQAIEVAPVEEDERANLNRMLDSITNNQGK